MLNYWHSKESQWQARVCAHGEERNFPATASASSARVERMFSNAGKMHRCKRKTMREGTLKHSSFSPQINAWDRHSGLIRLPARLQTACRILCATCATWPVGTLSLFSLSMPGELVNLTGPSLPPGSGTNISCSKIQLHYLPTKASGYWCIHCVNISKTQRTAIYLKEGVAFPPNAMKI